MHPELFAISKAIQTNSVAEAMAYGIEPEWFFDYREQWEYVVSHFVKKHKAPSVAAWSVCYPNISLKKIDEDWEYVADLLRNHSAMRCLSETGGDLFGLQSGDPVKKLEEVISSLSVHRNRLERESTTDIIRDTSARYRMVSERVEKVRQGMAFGIRTGFDRMDQNAPTVRGEYNYIFADFGSYKSYFCHFMCLMAAMGSPATDTHPAVPGVDVYIRTLEMSKEQVAFRFDTMLSSILGRPILNSQLNRTADIDLIQLKELYDVMPNMVPGRIWVDDEPCTVEGFVGAVTRKKNQFGDSFQLAVLDYIGLLEGLYDYKDYSYASKQLVNVIKPSRNDLALWVIGQAGRQAASREVRRGDSAGSYDMGRDADKVWTITKRENYGLIDVFCDKNRFGAEKWHMWVRPEPNLGLFDEVEAPTVSSFCD